MKWILIATLLLMWVSAGYAIPGDLNLDGVVDFSDFFIFSDNFGKEGSPDTLRVVVHDTVRVVVHDTLRIEIFDTVAVVDPVPTDFLSSEQIISRMDFLDLLDGLRAVEIEHKTLEQVRLGSDLARQDVNVMEVTYFDDGQMITKQYLKPAGHLLAWRTLGYRTEMVFQDPEAGHFEFWFEPFYLAGDAYSEPHEWQQVFDSSMAVIDTVEGAQISGFLYWGIA